MVKTFKNPPISLAFHYCGQTPDMHNLMNERKVYFSSGFKRVQSMEIWFSGRNTMVEWLCKTVHLTIARRQERGTAQGKKKR